MPRKTGKIKSNKTYLIVVEGETEHRYFSDIKASKKIMGVTVKLQKAKHSQPEYILGFALKDVEPYDSIWCVYDCDVSSKGESSEKAKTSEKKVKAINNIFCADSNPCFEIWFLLHYTMPKQYYKDQKEVINELKKHLANYKKAKSGICSSLKNTDASLKLAIENCLKLATRNKDNEYGKVSFCNVYKIFIELGIEEY